MPRVNRRRSSTNLCGTPLMSLYRTGMGLVTVSKANVYPVDQATRRFSVTVTRVVPAEFAALKSSPYNTIRHVFGMASNVQQ